MDYLQLTHTLAFCLFGLWISFRSAAKASWAGGVMGLSFLFFGLYRLKWVILHLRQTYKELKTVR